MTKYNYILVRVEERDEVDPPFLRAGVVRRAIHKIAEEYGYNVADNIIRHDRSYYPSSSLPLRPVPYEAAEQLMRDIMPYGWNQKGTSNETP